VHLARVREGDTRRQPWGRVVSDLNLVPLRGNQVHPNASNLVAGEAGTRFAS
jgi:hypothetical protein